MTEIRNLKAAVGIQMKIILNQNNEVGFPSPKKDG